MTTPHPWLWHHARHDDSELWSAGFATLAEAVADGRAQHDGAFYVQQASNPPLRLADWIDLETLLERADEAVLESDRAHAEFDEGPFFEASTKQLDDLETRLKRACDEWQAAHALVFTCRTFQMVGPAQLVPAPPVPCPFCGEAERAACRLALDAPACPWEGTA